MKILPHMLVACIATFSFVVRPANGDEDDLEPDQHDFLFFVEEAYLQEEGEWQLSIFSHSLNGLDVEEDGEMGVEDLFRAEFELELGLTETVSIELMMPYERLTIAEAGEGKESLSDWGDGEIGLSIGLLGETDSQPSVTFALEGSFPSGNEGKGLGRGVWGWETALRASKRVGEDLFVYGQLGFGFANDVVEEDDLADEREYEYGLAMVQRINEETSLSLELFGEYEEEKTEDEKENAHALYLAPGLIFEFENGLELGANLAIGLTDDSHDWGFGLRASVEY